jgi:uncharacterized membrane protein YkoI
MGSSAVAVYCRIMIRNPTLPASALALGLAGAALASPAAAQQQLVCLTQDQMREAVSTGLAIQPGGASRTAQFTSGGEVVRIRLCQGDGQLYYHVTLLKRDGRVGHVTIEGGSGKVASVR